MKLMKQVFSFISCSFILSFPLEETYISYVVLFENSAKSNSPISIFLNPEMVLSVDSSNSGPRRCIYSKSVSVIWVPDSIRLSPWLFFMMLVGTRSQYPGTTDIRKREWFFQTKQQSKSTYIYSPILFLIKVTISLLAMICSCSWYWMWLIFFFIHSCI